MLHSLIQTNTNYTTLNGVFVDDEYSSSHKYLGKWNQISDRTPTSLGRSWRFSSKTSLSDPCTRCFQKKTLPEYFHPMNHSLQTVRNKWKSNFVQVKIDSSAIFVFGRHRKWRCAWSLTLFADLDLTMNRKMGTNRTQTCYMLNHDLLNRGYSKL